MRLQQLLSNYLLVLLFVNKTWLSERFSLLSRYELLLLERFVLYFNFFYIFIGLPKLILIIIIINMIIFVIIVVVISVAVIISS